MGTELAGIWTHTPMYQRLEKVFKPSAEVVYPVRCPVLSKDCFEKPGTPPAEFERKSIVLRSKDLLDGFSSHQINLKDLQADQLVVVHCTSNLDTASAKILTAKDSGHHPRMTVHTTLNHTVGSHSGGNWEDKPYVILQPLDRVLQKNGKPVSLLPEDTFWDHSLDINDEHTVLLVATKKLPEKLQQELGDFSGQFMKEIKPAELGYPKDVKLKIFTVKNPYVSAKRIIAKMGRTPMPRTKYRTWDVGNLATIEDFHAAYPDHFTLNSDEYKQKAQAFFKAQDALRLRKEQLQKNGIQSLSSALGAQSEIHHRTVYGTFDYALGKIGFMSDWNRQWILNGHDYKPEILADLNAIKGKLGEQYNPDIQSCIEMIEKSKTPAEAEKQISKLFNVKGFSQLELDAATLQEKENYFTSTSQEAQEKELAEFMASRFR